MGITHRLDGGLLLLSFQRAFDAGAFGRADTARVDAIATDLHRIHRVRALLGAQTERAARLEAMLAGERARVLLVGAGLRLLEASPEARALLDRRDGLTLREGRVLPLDARATDRLRRAVTATVRRERDAPATLHCPRPAGASPWRLLVLPAPDEPACLVLMRGDDQPADRVRLWLTQRHGATPTEVVVAEALLTGATPDEIAAKRRVSLHTIRTQIRGLIEKTGARGNTALLLQLARLG